MAKTRTLTIIAQDPSVKDSKGKILRARVTIPFEQLGAGPRGYRLHVVDYDSTQQVLYRGVELNGDEDPFENHTDKALVSDPGFHAQNVYAIISRLLARFEAALGRRISWGFHLHQLNVLPHAFADKNAYYSEDAQGLFFGYFQGVGGSPIFTCLSHDVVTHEATHALLDGLRETYTVPSHPDQAGFHEGFADIVALLSVFGLPDIVRQLLPKAGEHKNRVRVRDLTVPMLRKNVLFGLAEQFGQEASRYRHDCLRRAVNREPRKNAAQEREFEEAHVRGEILSAAVLNALIEVWVARLATWRPRREKTVAIERVVEDGVDAANQLLTMCIRALDYCPVVDITFSDFLSALITADHEVMPEDGKYKYRYHILNEFKRWGIHPASGHAGDLETGGVSEIGMWETLESGTELDYSGIHRESLEGNPEEVFRFIYENRNALGIYEEAYSWVISVRPCMRVAPDGFILRETVSEYRQSLDLDAGQLGGVGKGLKRPADMPAATPIRLNGGGVLVFDEFGRLKFHIRSKIDNRDRQNTRLAYLWRNGVKDRFGRYGFSDGAPRGQRFASWHGRRDGRDDEENEEWGAETNNG